MEEPGHHRRVELQSPADLAYLEANVKRAARQKIDLHLPPSAAPEGEDALRRRVEKEVDDYIKNTFAGARHSISINGMPVPLEDTEDVEEFEPFDERLRDRLATLESQKTTLTERVARLRRTAPQQAARNFEAAYTAHDSALRDEAQRGEDEALHTAERDLQQDDMKLHGVKRSEEVAVTWKGAVEKLVEVSEGLPGTVGRLERAAGVVSYLKGPS